ncbi:MAG: alkyl hydroperoxide reductase/Thiol specific antioxidant/Mal allergen [Massilibacillus sp.]|jgi:thiol-disulfide isomerase/thioredoxin|nr:alkyl hydroperoxide reductase/Thiol specific antioxidant/Mal allergen [Massilibacillus sp.]
MNTKRKTILGILIFVAFLGIASFAYSTLTNNYKQTKDIQITKNSDEQDEYEDNENKKYPAPNFTVFDKQGNKVKLSDFAGKPIILNFWASWCPPCRSEMPHFNKAYATEKDNIVFMMVDLVDGQRETQAKGQKYVQDQGYDFPVYFDNEQQGLNTYRISSIPTTLIIDSAGNVVAEYQGAFDEKTLAKAINLIKH